MRPIMLDLPMPIVTPRLIIRPPKIGEGRVLHAATVESMKELKPWMLWAQRPPTPAQSEEYVRDICINWIAKTNKITGLPMFMIDKKTKMLVGIVAFHNMVWRVPRLEIGYWIRTSFTSRGLMTEAVNAATRYAISEIKVKRLEIRCEYENVRSRKIPENLAYHLESKLRLNHKNVKNEIVDALVYVRHDLVGLPDLDVRWGGK